MEIEDALRKLLNIREYYNHIGKVTEIDTEQRTCTVELRNGEAPLQEVRLQAMLSEDTGVVFFPEKDSDVIVGYLDDDEALILQTSKVSRVEIVTSGDIILNGDEFGGLVKIEKLTSKINKVVDDFNALVAKFNAHIHVTTATVGASTVLGVIAPVTTQASATPKLNKSDFENETVKHG